MRNYCYKVSKNGWRSHDKIDTITGIHVYELNKTKHDTELCEKGVMCEVYEEGTFYDEHDEFYFQAKNTVKASKSDSRIISTETYRSSVIRMLGCS